MRQVGRWRVWSDDEVEDGNVEMLSYMRMAVECQANWDPCRTGEGTESILLIGRVDFGVRCEMKAG
jgi:hypothetical protein